MNAEQHVPNKKQRELLDKHLELVIEENKVTNLTRIVDWESAQILHVEDSLAGLPEVQGDGGPLSRYGLWCWIPWDSFGNHDGEGNPSC